MLLVLLCSQDRTRTCMSCNSIAVEAQITFLASTIPPPDCHIVSFNTQSGMILSDISLIIPLWGL